MSIRYKKDGSAYRLSLAPFFTLKRKDGTVAPGVLQSIPDKEGEQKDAFQRIENPGGRLWLRYTDHSKVNTKVDAWLEYETPEEVQAEAEAYFRKRDEQMRRTNNISEPEDF